MNKRRLSKLEQGQGTTVFGRLLLTRRQCRNLLKWVLLALGYLAVQVLQDVAISRVRLFGGCPDVTVAYLLLACVLLGPDRGGLFALCAGVFRSLSGAVLGPVFLAVITISGVFLSAFRRAYLRRRFRTELLCCWLGLAVHKAVVYGLGLFLGYTALARWPSAVGGLVGEMAACALLYPVVNATGNLGGEPWNG